MIKTKKYVKIFLVLSLFFLVYFFYGNVLYFNFSIIDDHQTIQLIGPDNYLNYQDLIENLKDIFSNVISSKIRSTLIFLYVPIEVFIFQDNVNYYYIFRLIILTLFFVIIFNFSSNFIGNFNAFIITTIFLLSQSIHDIISRIYVSEFIIILSLVFLFPLFFKFVKNYNVSSIKNFGVGSSLVFLFSFIILIFSKESTLVLILIPILLLINVIKEEKKNFSLIFSIIIIIIFFSYNILLISNLLLNDESMISGVVSLEFINMVKIFLKFFKYIITNYFLHIFLIIYIYYFLKYPLFNFNLVLIIFINLILISYQFFIYNGNLPSHIRYDFILDLIFFINSFLLLIFLSHNDFRLSNIKLINIFSVFLLIVLSFKIFSSFDNKKNLLFKIKQLNYFHTQLDKVTKSAKLHNEDILLSSYNVWDYELISSWYKFLRFKGLKNDIYLKIEYSIKDMKNEVEKTFFKRLKDVSTSSDNKNIWTTNPESDWGFKDISKFNFEKKCVGLSILRDETKIIEYCEKSHKYIYTPF